MDAKILSSVKIPGTIDAWYCIDSSKFQIYNTNAVLCLWEMHETQQTTNEPNIGVHKQGVLE
jgi:hypothetical protein